MRCSSPSLLSTALVRKRRSISSRTGRSLLLLLLGRAFLRPLLNDTLLLIAPDEEVGDYAEGDKEGTQGPRCFFKHIRGLSGPKHLTGGPALRNTGEPSALSTLEQNHQNEYGGNEGDEDDHHRKHSVSVRL